MKFISKLLGTKELPVPKHISELRAKTERYALAHPVASQDAPPIFAVRDRTFDNPHPRLGAFSSVKNAQGSMFTEAQSAEVEARISILNAIEKGNVKARSQLPPAIYLREGFTVPDPFPSIFWAGTTIYIVTGAVARIMRSHDMGDAGLIPVTAYDNGGVTAFDQELYMLAPGTFRPSIKATSPGLSKNRYTKDVRFTLSGEDAAFREMIPLEQPENASSIWWDRIIQWSFFLNEALVNDLKSTSFEEDIVLRKVG